MALLLSQPTQAFLQGEPPIIMQILILNTVVLIIWVLRRARGAKSMRAATVNTVQAMLILANCVLLINGDYKILDFTRFWNIFS